MKLNDMLKKAEEKIKPEDRNLTDEIEAPWQTTSITTQTITKTEENHSDKQYIIDVETSTIQNWEFHDRPESELGDIQALANDFIKIGQQQPCVVRPTPPGSTTKYELIIGERRWRAAKLAGIDLKVIIKTNLSDIDAALSQAAENDNRVDLSDYAKGMSFSKLIDDKIIKQKDLIEKLGRSKQYVSALLSFSKIPIEIIDAVGDWSNVSARLGEKIKQLANKNTENIPAILSISSKIKEGKIGEKTIEKLIDKKLKPIESLVNTNQKVLSRDGRHIFTWRSDNNSLPSIHFPKQINDLFKGNKLSLDEFTSNVQNSIETMLKKL
jgi:ParB family chromosome partitioning protein